MMGTEIFNFDASLAEKLTKTRVSFLTAPTVFIKLNCIEDDKKSSRHLWTVSEFLFRSKRAGHSVLRLLEVQTKLGADFHLHPLSPPRKIKWGS